MPEDSFAHVFYQENMSYEQNHSAGIHFPRCSLFQYVVAKISVVLFVLFSFLFLGGGGLDLR